MPEDRPSREDALEAFYAGLPPLERDAFRTSDERLDEIEETDAEGTFRKGDALLFARAAVAKGHFLKWCELKWAYHRTYACSFMRVAERLGPLRDRLVAARVQRSSLLELGSRPEKAEEVLAAFESGRRPTVEEVKTMIGARPAVPPDGARPDDVGGLGGLGLLHAAKRKQLRNLAERFGRIVDAIEAALAAPRVMKGELAAAINLEARWARAELYNLCAFIEPAHWDATKPVPAKFAEGSGWDRTDRMLESLSWPQGWPPKGEIEEWLLEHVLPVLNWAAHGEPRGTEAALETEERESAEFASCSRSVPAERDTGEGGEMRPRITGRGGDEDVSPFNQDSIHTGASFVAFLRAYRQADGESPDAVEAYCRKGAEGLASIARYVFRHEPDKKLLANRMERLSDLFYRKSLTTAPMAPVKSSSSQDMVHSMEVMARQALMEKAAAGEDGAPAARPPLGKQ